MSSKTLRQSEKLADPTWYRIGYSLSAQMLHAVGEGPRTKRELGKRASAEIAKLRSRRSSIPVASQRGFGAAEHEALELISVTAAVLTDIGWRWAGRRPSWYVSWAERVPAAAIRFMRRLRRKPRRRTIAGDWALARFLDGTVEPAAVLLVWTARVAKPRPRGTADARLDRVKHALIELSHDGERRRPDQVSPLDRRSFSAEGDWLANYVIELADERKPERPAWRRLVGWVGYSRYRARGQPNARIQYNLACLFSRLAQAESEDGALVDEALVDRAARHLERSLSALPETRRNETADWAARDPNLGGLRNLGPEQFHRAVSQVDEPTPLATARIRGIPRVLFRLAAPIPALIAITVIVVGRAADLGLVEKVGWILLGATAISWIIGAIVIGWSSLRRTIAG